MMPQAAITCQPEKESLSDRGSACGSEFIREKGTDDKCTSDVPANRE